MKVLMRGQERTPLFSSDAGGDIRIHTYTHTYIDTHTHTHTHRYTSLSSWTFWWKARGAPPFSFAQGHGAAGGVYIVTHTSIYPSIYLHPPPTHIDIEQMNTHTHIFRSSTYIHRYIDPYIYIDTHTQTCIYKHIYIYMCLHICIYIYIYI